MRTLWLLTLAAVACTGGADRPARPGIQLGNEDVEPDDPGPCVYTEAAVGFADPAFADGSSAADVLATLPLTATASPAWYYDGAVRELNVELAYDGGAVTLVTATPRRPGDECPNPAVALGVAGTVTSEDGLVDESVAWDITVRPGEGPSPSEWIPAAQVGGSINADAIAAPLLGGADPRTAVLEVLLHLAAGEGSHGVITVIGWPGVSDEPTNSVEVVESTIAFW